MTPVIVDARNVANPRQTISAMKNQNTATHTSRTASAISVMIALRFSLFRV